MMSPCLAVGGWIAGRPQPWRHEGAAGNINQVGFVVYQKVSPCYPNKEHNRGESYICI